MTGSPAANQVPQNFDGKLYITSISSLRFKSPNSIRRSSTRKMSPHDDQLHRNKRRKVDSVQENDASTDITSHGQLRNLLTFQQNVNEVKQGQYAITLFVCSV